MKKTLIIQDKKKKVSVTFEPNSTSQTDFHIIIKRKKDNVEIENTWVNEYHFKVQGDGHIDRVEWPEKEVRDYVEDVLTELYSGDVIRVYSHSNGRFAIIPSDSFFSKRKRKKKIREEEKMKAKYGLLS